MNVFLLKKRHRPNQREALNFSNQINFSNSLERTLWIICLSCRLQLKIMSQGGLQALPLRRIIFSIVTDTPQLQAVKMKKQIIYKACILQNIIL